MYKQMFCLLLMCLNMHAAKTQPPTKFGLNSFPSSLGCLLIWQEKEFIGFRTKQNIATQSHCQIWKFLRNKGVNIWKKKKGDFVELEQKRGEGY